MGFESGGCEGGGGGCMFNQHCQPMLLLPPAATTVLVTLLATFMVVDLEIVFVFVCVEFVDLKV